MPLSAQITRINLQDISADRSWSLHPFLPLQPSANLLNSIKTIGILHPPILLKSEQNKYKILSGQFRISTLEHCDSHPELQISAHILSKNTAASTLLHVIFSDQRVNGKLSPMEEAYFYQLCLRHMRLEEFSIWYVSISDKTLSKYVIEQTLSLLTLETELQKAVHRGNISVKLATDLLKLNARDRTALFKLFHYLQLGGKKQKRLLSLCTDFAAKEGREIKDILDEAEVIEIIDHPATNLPQKFASLTGYLYKRLFPASSRTEEEFNRRVQRMDLPRSCHISHSPAFEQDTVSLSLSFSGLDELEKNTSKILVLMEKNH